MMRVLLCITTEHDLRLVVLAIIVCALATTTSFLLVTRARKNSGVQQQVWVAAAALAAGYGVWATHLIAMLAYKLDLQNGYDVPLTMLSALVGIAFNAGAFAYLVHAPARHTSAIAGGLSGLGIAAMHYAGMAGWHIAATKQWDWIYVTASIVMGAIVAAYAFKVAFSRDGLKQILLGSALMSLAIVIMHFTGMTALTLIPDATAPLSHLDSPPEWLALLVGVGTVALLAFGLFGAIVDQHFEAMRREGAATLQQQIEATRKSEAEARQLAVVAETTSDLVTIAEPDGRLTWANAAFTQTLGLPLSEVVGKRLSDLGFDRKNLSVPLMQLRAALERGESVSDEVELLTRSKQKFFLAGAVRAVRSDDGKIRQLIASHRDVTQQVTATARLRESEERYQLAVRGSSDGIWDWLISDDKAFFSSRVHELFGHGVDDPRLESMNQVQNLLHPEDRKRATAAMQAHLLKRVPYDIEHRVRLKNGTYRWFRARGQAKWDKNGQAIRMAGSLSDIDDLVRNKKAAEEASRLKSQFLANMSHEIRTPMNGVMGMCQLLVRTPLDEKQQRFANTILASSRSLLGIINDILDISKIESGLMTLNLDWFDVKELAVTAMARVEGLALQKNLTLRVDIADDADCMIHGDMERINQILINLLGNAIKFTDKGEVVLKIKAEADGNTKFAVVDTGPGIPADQLHVVFQRFRQVDGTSTRKHGGTGLGLAICKELVALMKGQINLESEVGVGTTFWFSVPLERKDKPKALDLEVQKLDDAASSNVAGKRVLVAEDNATNQAVIKAALELQKLAVTIVDNGLEALKKLETEHFDLVCMDIHMPGLNGDEAIRRIRASNAPYSKVPIIVVTASAMKGMEEKYIEVGADAYVPKPVEFEVLRDAVEKLLSLTAARDAA